MSKINFMYFFFLPMLNKKTSKEFSFCLSNFPNIQRLLLPAPVACSPPFSVQIFSTSCYQLLLLGGGGGESAMVAPMMCYVVPAGVAIF